jgi:hypothetical protein
LKNQQPGKRCKFLIFESNQRYFMDFCLNLHFTESYLWWSPGFDSFSKKDEILFFALLLSGLPNLEVIYAKNSLTSCDANRGLDLGCHPGGLAGYCPAGDWDTGFAQRHDDNSGQSAAPAGTEVRGRHQEKRPGFRPVVAAARGAAQKRAECAARPRGRLRLWHVEHLRRGNTEPDTGQARRQRAALHSDAHHRAMLADARRADERAQPPLDGLWRGRRGGHRVPGLRRHHHPTKEWIDKISTLHLFDGGWNKLRETIFANQKRLGVIPRDAKLTPWPSGPPEMVEEQMKRAEEMKAKGKD